MSQKHNDNGGDIEARVDEMMAVERDDRHPANKVKQFSNIVVEKPDLPMNAKHLEVKVIHPDKPKDDEALSFPQPLDDFSSIAETVDTNQGGDDAKGDISLIDSPETDQVVDDVLRQEEDRSEDVALGSNVRPGLLDSPAKEKNYENPGLFSGLGRWLREPRHWLLIVLFLSVVLLVVLTIPASRYGSLNALGVRTKASLSVVDNSTDMPLKNVDVTIGAQTKTSDEEGRVEFDDLRLGKQKVRIERRAFAERNNTVVLGVRDNELGEYWLFPTGVQYQLTFHDFVAGVPIAGVEVTHDDVSAFSDDSGIATLTVDVAVDETMIDVVAAAEGYRKEQLSLPIDQTDQVRVTLSPELKHVYVRPPPSEPDIMAAYLDGEGEVTLLEATGLERRDITIVPHPNENRVAVFTTQDDARSPDEFLLTTLTIIDVQSGEASSIAQSERLQPVGWYGDRFVYVKARSGVTGMDTRRHQLISYDYNADRDTLLATSNYFNAILPTERYIYYAPSSIFLEESTTLRRASPDGSVDESVTIQEAWSVYRHDFRTFAFATNSQWYEYDLLTGDVVERSEESDTITSRLYLQNPLRDDWYVTSHRDDDHGRELLFYDNDDESYATLVQGGDLRHPVRWLHESIVVYRVEVDEQFVDYAYHFDGEEPRKLWSVGASSGLERWYSF